MIAAHAGRIKNTRERRNWFTHRPDSAGHEGHSHASIYDFKTTHHCMYTSILNSSHCFRGFPDSFQNLFIMTDWLTVIIRLRKTDNMTRVFKDNRGRQDAREARIGLPPINAGCLYNFNDVIQLHKQMHTMKVVQQYVVKLWTPRRSETAHGLTEFAGVDIDGRWKNGDGLSSMHCPLRHCPLLQFQRPRAHTNAQTNGQRENILAPGPSIRRAEA